VLFPLRAIKIGKILNEPLAGDCPELLLKILNQLTAALHGRPSIHGLVCSTVLDTDGQNPANDASAQFLLPAASPSKTCRGANGFVGYVQDPCLPQTEQDGFPSAITVQKKLLSQIAYAHKPSGLAALLTPFGATPRRLTGP